MNAQAISRITSNIDRPAKKMVPRLLDSMADEWAALAETVAALGDFFSADALARGSLENVKQLQTFDALSQMANSQGIMLRGLARELAESSAPDALTVAALIERVPLETVREQMYARIFAGPPNQRPAPAMADDDFFFED